MSQALQQLLDGLLTTTGATQWAIDAASQTLGESLPPDYIEVMLITNGCEGFVGQSYFRLYPVENLAKLNAAFGVQEFAPGLVIFGSNGGGEAFAFDMRTSAPGVVQLPFIPMAYEYIIERSPSFADFLVRMARPDPGDHRTLPTHINPDTLGKEIHEITPIVFGGSPTDPANKAYLTTEQYAEYVVWWNRTYRNVRSQGQSS